jgi:hypothetical protein
MVRSFVSALCCGLALAACAAPSDESTEGSEAAITAGAPQLLVGVAQSTSVDADFANRSDFTSLSALSARLRIAAPGSAGKHVYVRYRAQDKTGKELRAWSNVDATWVAGNVWEVRSPQISRRCAPSCAGIDYAFAVAVESGGRTTWNNNGTANFQVTDGPVTVAQFGEQRVLRAGDYYSSSARKVLVRAMHGDAKGKVTVHYSIDGWATAQDVVAQTSVREQSGKVITDLAYLPVPPGKTVDYAIRYEVDGAVSWDNNVGRNYRIVTAEGT